MPTVKTYDYILVLKRTRSSNLIDLISRLMLVMALVTFLFESVFWVISNETHAIPVRSVLFTALSIIIIGWWFYCYGLSKKGEIPYYRFALLIAAVGWFLHPKGTILFIIYLVATILERPVKLPPEIAFDHESIVFNSFPAKKYSWKELNNVVLKDGLLTIDLKTNKLIQREVNAEVSAETEKEFNDFCNTQFQVSQQTKAPGEQPS